LEPLTGLRLTPLEAVGPETPVRLSAPELHDC
jgi:hypothetical protein